MQTVAELGFSEPGVSIHSGHPFQELQIVQNSQQFIEFLFIWLNTSKFLEHSKPNFFIENINFPPIWLHLGLCSPGQLHHSCQLCQRNVNGWTEMNGKCCH